MNPKTPRHPSITIPPVAEGSTLYLTISTKAMGVVPPLPGPPPIIPPGEWIKAFVHLALEHAQGQISQAGGQKLTREQMAHVGAAFTHTLERVASPEPVAVVELRTGKAD